VARIETLFVDTAHILLAWLTRWGLSQEAADLVLLFVQFACLAGIITVNVIVLVWLERRVSGFIQLRLGPNRVGPFGTLQTVADALKLLTKEDIVPSGADRPLFKLAPVLFMTVAVMLYAVLPFGRGMQVVDLNIGLFYFLSLGSLATIALLMAGWGSNNKWSLLGAMRSVAQIISYEIPLVLSLLGVVMIAGSLRLSDIVAAQEKVWFILLQPVAFITYFIAATAELNRAPFDMPEAEQELTAGAYTEYSGMRWALFFLAEYTNLFAVSALAATMFLGGWHGPGLPSWLWIVIKTYGLMLVFMWIRWTFPRIRMDQLMAFNWKVLIPVTLANLMLTGVGVYLAKGVAG